MHRKILVAADGSVYSSCSLDYLIRLFRNDPELSVDLLGVIPADGTILHHKGAEGPCTDLSAIAAQRSTIASSLYDAGQRLQRNGFSTDQISVSLLSTPLGAAEAVHQQLLYGSYDSLLIGRRGMGRLGELLLGSVSAELLCRCHETPVWLLDGDVASSRFLLAVHNSLGSLSAADHVACILSGCPEAEIFIYHSFALFGSGPVSPREDFEQRLGKDWCGKHLDFETCLYQAHTDILLDNGIAAHQIRPVPPHRDFEVGHDLLRQAKRHDCGTIIVGRRGPTDSKGLLGGVSDRIIRQAENLAVWIVG
jgi:nucleotide-binding universal stress UspA family protein